MATTPREERIDLGRVVQRGFWTIGRNWVGFGALSLLFAGIPNFVLYFVTTDDFGGNSGDWIEPLTNWSLVLATLFAGYLLQAAIVRTAILDLTGRPADLIGSAIAGIGIALPLLGLIVVSGFAIMIGLLLLIVPGVVLYVMWIVAVPAMVEEELGVMDSLTRSSELTQGSRWQIFGLILVFMLVWVGVASASGILNAETPSENRLLFALVNSAVTTLTGLLAAAMLASLYVELRNVKEGAATNSLAAIFD